MIEDYFNDVFHEWFFENIDSPWRDILIAIDKAQDYGLYLSDEMNDYLENLFRDIAILGLVVSWLR